MISGVQNKYFKGIYCCRYCGSQQQHSLTLRTYLYWKSFNSVSLFYPILKWISMETGSRCRARWQITAAAHNIRILIGQITCQSSSLLMVNCFSFILLFSICQVEPCWRLGDTVWDAHCSFARQIPKLSQCFPTHWWPSGFLQSEYLLYTTWWMCSELETGCWSVSPMFTLHYLIIYC